MPETHKCLKKTTTMLQVKLIAQQLLGN